MSVRLKLPEARWTPSLSDHWRRALEILRWRGPLRFLVLVAREILKPILYWHVYYIIENDLSRQLPVLYAKRPFEVGIYRGEKDLAAIEPQLSAMGELTPEEISWRAKHGDLVGVAYAGSEVVGYSWMSCSSGLPLAFDVTWIVSPNEAVLYGSFVRSEWRGQGVHSSLDVALNGYAREQGILRTIASMAVYNSQTLALAKRTGKQRVMIVALARVCAINRTWAKAFGAPLNSYFRLQRQSGSARAREQAN